MPDGSTRLILVRAAPMHAIQQARDHPGPAVTIRPRSVRVGIHSGQQYSDFGAIRRLWQTTESLGYDWISVFEHFRPVIFGPDGPCLDGMASLSALAAS